MSFSERYGYKPVREVVQIESMDIALRNGLWNILTEQCWRLASRKSTSRSPYILLKDNQSHYDLCKNMWDYFFHGTTDRLPVRWDKTLEVIREYYFRCSWFQVYDFIEFVAHNYKYTRYQYTTDQQHKNKPKLQSTFIDIFTQACNERLKMEISAYRFVGGQITRIIHTQEIDAIEQAIDNKLPAIAAHIQQSLAHLSDRQNPDYRNSIKESISAVESLVKKLAGNDKGTLGQLIKQLEDDEVEIHPALKGAFDKLYGYTSDADGIRHAIMDQDNTDFHDAKFMLVTCSAFINYVEGKLQEQ